MSSNRKYESFVYESYEYDPKSGIATFRYSFDGALQFCERVILTKKDGYNKDVLDRALQLAHIVAGISYYKAFPVKRMIVKTMELSLEQAAFFSEVYRDGLSQYIYENQLDPDVIARFESTHNSSPKPAKYEGNGIIALQSGGKDSLLLAELLHRNSTAFTPWHLSASQTMPAVLDSLKGVVHRTRKLDTEALSLATKQGGLNGHIPITLVIASYALLDAILLSKNTVLLAIGNEGEEPYAHIGDYAVRHQWSKTWHTEQLLAQYIATYISADLRIGSPLRQFSELKISELFVAYGWQKYGNQFASCNLANYQQGHDNTVLTWCGNCAKCANSYLLFAAFVAPEELNAHFGRKMFENTELANDFRGLLGIEGYEKPFECVAETDELRKAYELALKRGHEPLPFDVSSSDFDKDALFPSQSWASGTIKV